MSVYTHLSKQDISHFLEDFELGELKSFSGIKAGVENSNYFVTTSAGEYVLTLFELRTADSLPPFIKLTTDLAKQSLPVPYPICDRQGRALKTLADKPCLLFPRAPGRHVLDPGPAHCAAIGGILGRIHLHTRDQLLHRSDRLDERWIEHEPQSVLPCLHGDEARLLETELAAGLAFLENPPPLPEGIIHADLFRDNVLFEGKDVSGVIDFYNAYSHFLLYDLAVVANDWCSDPDGRLNSERCQALVLAYHAERPLQSPEFTAWPALLRLAALRFWVMRLIAVHLPKKQKLSPGVNMVLLKDPKEYRRILEWRIQADSPLKLADS